MKKIVHFIIVFAIFINTSVVFGNTTDITNEEFYDFFTHYLMCDYTKQENDYVRRDECVAYICRAVGMDRTLFYNYAMEVLDIHSFMVDKRETGLSGYLFFAYCNKIIAGTGFAKGDGWDDTMVFAPARDVTYEEAIAFAVRTAVSNDLRLTMEEQWDLAVKYGIVNECDDFYEKRKEKAKYKDIYSIVERVLNMKVNTHFDSDLHADLAMRNVIRTTDSKGQSNFEYIKENFRIESWISIDDPLSPWSDLCEEDLHFAEIYNILKQ